MGWAVGVAIIVIVLGVVLWLLLEDSLVRIDSGHLGLVLFKGAATDRVLLPGPHFVPTFRRKMVEVYPSLELAYRAGDSGAAEPAEREYEHGGPALVAVLGDNCSSTIAYTVRFRIDPGQLRQVHERFGNDGIWAAVRDGSSLAVRKGVSDEQVGVTDFFGPSRGELEARLSQAVGEVLAQDGFAMVLFALGDTDLGRTGAVIEATARARYELPGELVARPGARRLRHPPGTRPTRHPGAAARR